MMQSTAIAAISTPKAGTSSAIQPCILNSAAPIKANGAIYRMPMKMTSKVDASPGKNHINFSSLSSLSERGGYDFMVNLLENGHVNVYCNQIITRNNRVVNRECKNNQKYLRLSIIPAPAICF